MVVGIRHTSKETRTITLGMLPDLACAALNWANGASVITANMKIKVRPAIRMFRAISFGVFWRWAPSTRAIIRSRNVSPGLEVIRTLM